MSEKRFIPNCNFQKCAFVSHIKDNEEEVVLDINEIVDKLNELNDENEQLRRLFEEMKQPITVNLTEEDEKELRKLLGIDCDE